MKNDIPVVMFYEGSSWFLPYTLQQARHVCQGKNEVVHIGGLVPLEGILTLSCEALNNNSVLRFMQHYRHMSTNVEKFEVICWLRWFYLLEYMKQYNVESVLHLDPDVLLYSPIETIFETHIPEGSYCSLSIPDQTYDSYSWDAGGHFSYWTRSALEEFCQFALQGYQDRDMINRYEEKWNWHQNNNVPGGICDMTGLYLFWNERQDIVVNTLPIARDHAIDHCINIAEGTHGENYQMEQGKKAIVRTSEGPCIVLCGRNGTHLVHTHSLHFQGGAKRWIPSYYTGMGFAGKRRSDLKCVALRCQNRVKRVLKSIC